MNRHMRRAARHQKPPKVTPISKVIDEFNQFDDIDRLVQKLEHGAIEVEQGRPVMTTKGRTYDVISALEGWLEYWRMLADRNHIAYDDQPMRAVSARLENGMPLTPLLIDSMKNVVAAQRAMFRAIPRRDISSHATTVQIKLAMEDCGIIAP